MDDQIQVEPAAEDVRAEVAGLVCLGDRGPQPASAVHQFPAQVDEGVVRPHRERGDDDALDQRMWVGHHQRRVLAGTGLALIRVDDQIVRFAVALRDEAPLHAGGEASAATAPQTGVLDKPDDGVRTRLQRLAQRLVTIGAFVGGERPGLGSVPASGENRGDRHGQLPFV